jgi:hypothetical protein
VSKLLRGHFAGYAYERLFGYLNALGERVSIAVSQAKTKKDARLELEMTDRGEPRITGRGRDAHC